MTRLLGIAALLLVLSACATAKETYTPNGQKGFTIDCSGSALNWGMCTQKAGDLCGAKGYTILQSSKDQSSMLTSNQFGTYASPIVNRSMTVQCGKN